jgi:anti-anti-sigma factor
MSAQQQPLGQLLVGQDFTIYNAAKYKEDYLSQLSLSQGLEVDLAQVEEIDSAGLQILMLLKREADATGKALQLVNHSRAVVEVFELLDLAGYFGDPLVIPAEWHRQ